MVKPAALSLDEDIPFEFRGRGRPRKNVPGRNIKVVSAADFGMTRRQMFEAMRLAEVPDDEFERILALPWKEKISAIRHIKSGQWRRGAVDNDAHIRLPRELFDILSRHAKHQGKSVSDLTVELVDIALAKLLDPPRA
jgi:hypothetical protein